MHARSKPSQRPQASKPTRKHPTIHLSATPGKGRPTKQPVQACHTIQELRPAGAIRSAEAEKAIRRHVTQGLPKGRRLVIRNRIELCLPVDFVQAAPLQIRQTDALIVEDSTEVVDTPQLGTNSSSTPESVLSTEQNLQLSTAASPASILGAGRIDPFGNYPIKMTRTEQWLLDEVHTNTNPLFRTFQYTWLPTAIHDSAMFHQLLANIAINVYRIQGRESTNLVSMRHHARALIYVNNHIDDREKNVSDGVVCCVGTFVCYSAYTEDFKSLDMHLSGLESIVRMRGGWKSFDGNQTLRIQLFQVDLAGACRRDKRPRFPLPEVLLREVQLANGSLSLGPCRGSIGFASCLALFRHDRLLLTAFHDLSVTIEYAKEQVNHGESWTHIGFCVFWIDPIVHCLVGQEFPVNDSDVFQEVTRLGLLIFLSSTRRQCGQLGVSTKLFASKLKSTISDLPSSVSWGVSNILLLWSLFVGMLEGWHTPEKQWYLERTAKIAYEMGFWGWDDTFAAVKNFIWIGGNGFDDELRNFHGPFESALDNLILRELSIETVS